MTATLIETCHRMSNIVQGLVDFSTEQVNAPVAPTLLKEVVDMSFDLVRSRFESAHIAFNLPDIDPYLVVECRRSDIAKVLFNLLINSLESVQHSDERWVSIQVIDVGHSVTINVLDSGAPIAAHVKDKIFEPFFTTKGTAHTGLGLSISKGIMENHGGSIAVASSAKNACITLTLPKKSVS